MTSVKATDFIETCEHFHCAICDASCQRFPYQLKFHRREGPDIVCRACFRVAMVLEHFRIYGGYEVVTQEVEKP